MMSQKKLYTRSLSCVDEPVGLNATTVITA